MRNTILGALVAWAAVALATPQGTLIKYPIGNSTTQTITPTNTGTACDSQCSVAYPELSAVRWIPESDIVYTTEVVVATVTSILVMSANVTLDTQVYTVYNTDDGKSSIPPEYSLYFRGSDLAGTAIVTIAFPTTDAMTYFSILTYPTSYVDYSTEYHWEGILSTTDKAFQPICATATVPDRVPLLVHPNYPQPTAVPENSGSNSTGTEYIPLWLPVGDQPDITFFQNAFPDQSAFASCEPANSTPSPTPTRYSAPKYITDTTTIYKSSLSTEGLVHIETTATGWDVTTAQPTFEAPHLETTVSGFETEPPDSGIGGGGGGPPPAQTTSTEAHKVHLESSVTGINDATPIVDKTHDLVATKPAGINTRPAPDLPGIIISLIHNHPSLFPPAQPPRITENSNPTPVAVELPQNIAPTPVFTLVPTVIDGQSTTIPAYLLPDSSTATIGQAVTLNGQTTILAPPPPLLYTSIPITLNGIETLSPVYIISGTLTASLGQTITMSAATTVLAAPGAVFTTVPTTLSGTSTNIPAYLIGSSTATIGQTVVLGGSTTVRPGATGPPILKFTMITTTVSGKETTFASYVEDTTAGGGKTEVVGGTTTVLALPSSTAGSASASESTGSASAPGSMATTSGGASATTSGPAAAESTPGAAGRTVLSWGMIGVLGIGVVSLLLM